MRRKTTVYLENESLRKLKRMAKQSGKSEAELIRKALDQFVASGGRPKLTCIGIAKGPGDLGARADEYLEKLGFGRDGLDR